MKPVYRDFEHWWTEGNHGYSSASRECAIDIWNDLEPTINASRDDYKNAFVELTNRQAKQRADVLDAAISYINQFSKEGAPKFWRWYLDKTSKGAE